MNRVEFLKELEEQLKDKLPETDLEEILFKYNNRFESEIAEGKWESAIAVDIGAPAMVAKTIIDEKYKEAFKLLQYKLNELSSMGKRLAAYFIDGVILNSILFGVIYVIVFMFDFLTNDKVINGDVFAKVLPTMTLIIVAGISNILESIILWKTNGYTPGKLLLKMRVEKKDKSTLTYGDAFLREVVIKCLGSAVTSGLLNIFSFVWACATPEKKTIQDLAASTWVINVK